MLKLTLLITSLFLLTCCQNQNAQSQEVKSTEKIEKKTPQQPAKNVKTQYHPKSSQGYNPEFPFDIPLKTVDGEIISSNEILKKNGKPTVIFFWLTTCAPCHFELRAVAKKYPSWVEQADFNLFAISTDFEKNYEKFVKMVNQKNWPFEAYNDVERKFRFVMPGKLNGLPQSFIFDKDGKIVYHKRKYSSGDEDVLFAKVLELVGK